MWHSWFDSIVFGIKATLKVFPVDAIYYAFFNSFVHLLCFLSFYKVTAVC